MDKYHPSTESVDGLLDVVAAIRDKRRKLLTDMRACLLAGDDAGALIYARKLTGLPDKADEGQRTKQRKN